MNFDVLFNGKLIQLLRFCTQPMDGVYRAKFFLDIKNYHKEAKLLFIFIYIGKDRAPLRASENLIFGQPERFPRYVLLPPSVGIYTFIYLPVLVASTCLIIIELSPSYWAPGGYAPRTPYTNAQHKRIYSGVTEIH